jgi:CHAD domain-containing protein
MEHVHQLRVATRRAVAAVELYGGLIPRKPRRKLCRHLKRIRRAAGTARDCDVLIARQAPQASSAGRERLLATVRHKRAEAQQPLVDICRCSLEDGLLDQLSDRALRKLRAGKRRKTAPRFRRWAVRQLRRSVKAFFKAEPKKLNDLEGLHEFRLRGKDLRYAMELLAAAFPRRFRSKLYPVVEQLQDHLGNINDHAVAIERFRDWRDESTAGREGKELKRLRKAERKLLEKSLWDFANWWTPHRSKRVQKSFARLVD